MQSSAVQSSFQTGLETCLRAFFLLAFILGLVFVLSALAVHVGLCPGVLGERVFPADSAAFRRARSDRSSASPAAEAACTGSLSQLRNPEKLPGVQHGEAPAGPLSGEQWSAVLVKSLSGEPGLLNLRELP